jgi:hypothetical protein
LFSNEKQMLTGFHEIGYHSAPPNALGLIDFTVGAKYSPFNVDSDSRLCNTRCDRSP